MRFSYTYRTSDGVRHADEVVAASREEAFAMLRQQGIRAIKVQAVGGGRRTVTARGVTLGLVMAGVVGLIVAIIMHGMERNHERPRTKTPSVRFATVRPRRMLPTLFEGEPLCGTKLLQLFSHPSEAYLACFAQPGVRVEWDVAGDITEMLKEDLVDALDEQIPIKPDDTRAIAELKRIVSGLKDEVAMLISSGRGIEEIRNWLEARQKMEVEYRDQILIRVEDEELSEEDANALLGSMGFAPVPQ